MMELPKFWVANLPEKHGKASNLITSDGLSHFITISWQRGGYTAFSETSKLIQPRASRYVPP